MDVRSSVYALVDRVSAGASIDDAAEGLDLGWDYEGNHASDFLCMPGVWKRLDEARLFELVDWFLSHGANGAHLLEQTLSDIQYAGEGPNPIRRHLLSLPSPPDFGRALLGAFCRRRLGLARALVERGADPAVLGDWVEADLVTPASIDVQYQPSDAEQEVSLTMRIGRLQPEYAAEVQAADYMPRLMVRLGQRGLLAGASFDPRSSRVTEASIDSDVTKAFTDVRLKLRVRGVGPAGLALVFRSFVGRNPHWYPRSIALKGEIASGGDGSFVDSARARSWFQDFSVDRFLPPRALSFEVTAKPRKRMFAIVEHREGLGRDIHAIGQALDPELLQAPSVGFDVENAAGAFAHFDTSAGATTKTEVLLKRFGPGAVMDPAPLRAAYLHGLAALEGVTSVRWCDDAGATETVQAAAKPAAKAKRARPVAVEHPDRGPSRIAALLKKIGSSPLPWASVGAASGPIPTNLGNDVPMPATLRAWLEAGHAKWPLSSARPFQERSFRELVTEVHPEMAEVLAPLGEQLLAGGCIPVFVPSACADGTILFLHMPLADADGEAPVIGFDPTDEGLVGVFAPRFDHYIARVLGLDGSTTTFAPGPLADPYLTALVGRLPARQRTRARPSQGVVAVGALLGGGHGG